MKLRPPINPVAFLFLLAILFPNTPLRLSAQDAKTSAAEAENQKRLLAEAAAQLARGSLEEAENPLWKALETDPNHEQALTMLGTIRVRQRRYSEAEAVFRRVLQINPNSLAAHRGLGSTLTSENRTDEAIKQYSAAIDLAPGDLGSKMAIAQLFAGRGQFQQVLDTMQTIPRNKFPVDGIPIKAASLLALGKSTEAMLLAEQAKGSPITEIALAEVFVDAKLPDQALRSLDFAAANLKRRPARFYYVQGRALEAQGHTEAALKTLKQALDEDPNSTDTLVASAELYAGLNQHTNAVTALQKALALRPDSMLVLRNLVVEATKAGNGQVAVDAASALAAKSSDTADDLYLAGAALLQQNAASASSVFEKVVALRADNAKAWLGLGMAYAQQHSYAAARNPLERAMKLDPNLAEAEYQLGVVAKNVGTSEEAIEHFQRATKLDPRHAKALWSLGNLYLQSGQLEEAQGELQMAEALDPNNLETEYDLGLVLNKLGKPELARDHFDRYRKLKAAQAPADRDAR